MVGGDGKGINVVSKITISSLQNSYAVHASIKYLQQHINEQYDRLSQINNTYGLSTSQLASLALYKSSNVASNSLLSRTSMG